MLNAVFKALAEPERRRLLFDLAEANPQHDTPTAPEGRPVAADEEQRQKIALYHKHLPMLERAGFIEWDREAGEVTKGSGFETDLLPVLQALDDNREELPGSLPRSTMVGDTSQ